MSRCVPLVTVCRPRSCRSARRRRRPAHVRARRQPILTRAGCNAGACHGKARGQNGFALSLLGFDPDFDYDAIATEARGRRVFPAAPEQSLLLRKATGQVPHGGGKKLADGEPVYETLRRWIAAGMPAHAGRRAEAASGSPSSRPSGSWRSGDEQQLARHRPLLRRLDART